MSIEEGGVSIWEVVKELERRGQQDSMVGKEMEGGSVVVRYDATSLLRYTTLSTYNTFAFQRVAVRWFSPDTTVRRTKCRIKQRTELHDLRLFTLRKSRN